MKWLITGGAGFIGCHVTKWLIDHGHEVLIVDNLSRPGSEVNLTWLQAQFPGMHFLRVDVSDYPLLFDKLKAHPGIDVVLHLAAQVAVTTSVLNPLNDFEINARGTLNVLEAVRSLNIDPIILYSSTNKVYGTISQHPVTDLGTRYAYHNLPEGISEDQPLDFHSPYGCSKGAADQYVRDYSRIYGLRTVVFRQSCIYGTRQFGVEDQGWVAWFAIAAALRRPITIYGDGKQVRDILYVDDLVKAYLLAVDNIRRTQGEIYNIGGGPGNTLAVWTEFGPLLEILIGYHIPVGYADWRPGDQKVFVSDIAKARRDFGWSPQIGVKEGISKLVHWVLQNKGLFEGR